MIFVLILVEMGIRMCPKVKRSSRVEFVPCALINFHKNMEIAMLKFVRGLGIVLFTCILEIYAH